MVNAEPEPTVVLRSGAGDHLVGYTAALRQLSEISIGRHAVIGGFAVMVRLATAHRVTDDLDAVTWTEDGTPDGPIAVLLEHGATRSRNGVDLGDVHIDLIAVSDYEPDQLPVDVDDTMFVIAHTYGLSSATWLTIEARDAHDVSTRATARVATPAALVAMKLRAMQQRRANVLNKRASDAYDAYRLLAAHDRDGSIARDLATAPDGLGAWCISRAREVFDTNASQTRRWLATTGSPDMAAVSIDELRTVGSLFADVLADLLRD